MQQVFLSRRNLLALLSKLDRAAAGEVTACTIIKHNGQDPRFDQTMPICAVTAIEDAVYYGTRQPGAMHPADEPVTSKN